MPRTTPTKNSMVCGDCSDRLGAVIIRCGRTHDEGRKDIDPVSRLGWLADSGSSVMWMSHGVAEQPFGVKSIREKTGELEGFIIRK